MKPDDNDNNNTLKSIKVNTTGGITVSSLRPLCILIAKHIKHNEIPSGVFRLFRPIIDTRTSAHVSFQQVAAEPADPAIQESNVKQKFLMKSTQDWNPSLDLQQPQNRRDCNGAEHTRSTGYNYYLVNLFPSIVIQRNAKGENPSAGKG